MSHNVAIYELIHTILKKESGYISTEELARRLGNQTAREMRKHGGTDALLQEASMYIAQMYGAVIVRTMSPGGIKLSSDMKEINAAREQWAAFSTKIKRVADGYDDVKKALRAFQERCAAQNQMALEI